MKTPQQIAEIGFWINELDHKTVAEAIYLHAKQAIDFFGPEVAWRIDMFEMRQTAMRKLQS